MSHLTPAEQSLLESELSPGEAVLWTGKPNPRVLFHSSDAYMVPVSLFWAGFAIFWELGVSGKGFAAARNPNLFMTLWGVPFVLIGQYLIWGRFVYVRLKKRYVVYALTTERVLVLVHGWGAKTITGYLRSLPGIQKQVRHDGIGTLKFGEASAYNPKTRAMNQNGPDNLYLSSALPVFADIDNAAQVAALANQAIRHAQEITPNPPLFR